MRRCRTGAICAVLVLLGACGGSGGEGPSDALALASVTPAQGTSLGGTVVTLVGQGFTGDTVVTVGENLATVVDVESQTRLTCSTPSGPAGQAVPVTVARGSATSAMARGFTYHPTPTVTALEPDTWLQTGGLDVELTGRGFTAFEAGSNAVHIGGSPVVDLLVVDDTMLRFRTPSTGSGPLDVRLSNANGQAVLSGGFTAFRYPLAFRTPRTRLGVDVGSADVGDPRLTGDDGYVYAAWSDYRHGRGVPYANGSHDHGATWMASDVQASALTAPDLGVVSAYRPELCCDGESLYVVWLDYRNGGYPQTDVYFNRSLDGGTTWLGEDVWLDDDSVHADSFAICCEAATVHVVWRGRDAPHSGIYYQRSVDGGATWPSPAYRLDDAHATGVVGTAGIACQGNRVAAVWHESRDGGSPSVYVRTSADGGATWPSGAKALASPGVWAAWPRATVEGDTVHVAWLRDGVAKGTAYARSTNGGADWPAAPTLFDAGKGGPPRLRSDGDYVYATWFSFQGDGTYTLLLNASTDGGATWQGETQLNADTLTNRGGTTELCCEQERVFVVWGGEHDGRDDVYFTSSLDAGATWLPEPLTMDAGVDFGQASTPPKVYCTCTGPHVHVIWEEGDTEVNVATSEP